jgi:uncharacterized membrane protein YccC
MTVLDALRAKDPDLINLRKATRAMVVCVPVFVALNAIPALSQASTFAFFGAFVGLIFANFGGQPKPRAFAYLLMIIVGDVVILIGTLLAGAVTASAVAMFIIMFTVSFAAVFGGYTPAFVAPIALGYSLSVLYPLGDLGLEPRLVGWTIGGAVALIAAIVLWPVYGRDRLRGALADASAGLAAVVENLHDRAKAEASYRGALNALAQARQRASAPLRPAGPLSRDVALLHLTRNLEQAADMTRRILDGGWTPGDDDQIAAACADAFHRTSAALRGDLDPAAVTQDAPRLSDALEARRVTADVAAMRAMAAEEGGADTAMTMVRRSFPMMALSHIAVWVEAVAATAIGANDAISPVSIAPEVTAIPNQPTETLARARRIVGRGFDPDGVIFRNSIRAAAAMTLAVILAKLLPVDHGFWVTLGALLVLRSNANSTSASALQAIIGTFVGFILAAGVVMVFDNHDTYLLYILPFLVFLAGYTPGAVSFMIGQVSFTLLMVVLFTLIDKEGLATDLARLETVSVGAASGAVMALVLWPRGARAALARAVAGIYRTAAQAMGTLVTGPAEARAKADHDMYSANRHAEEAFGIALSEHGRQIDVAAWMALSRAPNTAHSMVAGLLPTPAPWLAENCNAALTATVSHRDRVAAALTRVADRLDHPGGAYARPAEALQDDALTRSLMTCFESARREGREHVDSARLLVAWNEWLSFIDDYISRAEPQLDQVVAVSQARSWLWQPTPKGVGEAGTETAGSAEPAASAGRGPAR